MSDLKRDLFGDEHAPLTNPKGLINVALTEVPARSTEKAVFLTAFGEREGHHVGRSKVKRGVGPWINHWTMPRWLARENGWL